MKSEVRFGVNRVAVGKQCGRVACGCCAFHCGRVAFCGVVALLPVVGEAGKVVKISDIRRVLGLHLLSD